MLVPWCAISGNIEFMQDKSGVIETSDGVLCSAIKYKEIHILSKEAYDIVQELYKMQVLQFMRKWYEQIPRMSEMWFVYLKLEKIKEDVATPADPTPLSTSDN